MISGSVGSGKPSVLFVCVHNAGRSQMAQGFLTRLAGERIEVCSAGSVPAESINPAAVEAMREVGIDITGQAPESPHSRRSAGIGCGDHHGVW